MHYSSFRLSIRNLLLCIYLGIRRASARSGLQNSVECEINCMLYYNRLLGSVNTQDTVNAERFYTVQNLALQLVHHFDSYLDSNIFAKTSIEILLLSALERYSLLYPAWEITSGLQLLIHRCRSDNSSHTDIYFFSVPGPTELKIYAAIISLYILAFGGKAETLYEKGLYEKVNEPCSDSQILLSHDSALCMAVSKYGFTHTPHDKDRP